MRRGRPHAGRFASIRRWTLRLVALAATAGLLAAGAATAVALMPAPDAPVNGRTLFLSLEHGSGSAGRLLDDAGSCVRGRAAGRWRCEVLGRQGSGRAAYRLRVAGAGPCWTARLLRDHSESGMPGGVDGCVRGDRWSPLDLIRP